MDAECLRIREVCSSLTPTRRNEEVVLDPPVFSSVPIPVARQIVFSKHLSLSGEYRAKFIDVLLFKYEGFELPLLDEIFNKLEPDHPLNDSRELQKVPDAIAKVLSRSLTI